MSRVKSILQDEKACYITGRTDNLNCHHIFFGSNRKVSDENGFWVYLNVEYHTMSPKAVHVNHELDMYLKRTCQRKFEETHTRQEFMALIGRNFL